MRAVRILAYAAHQALSEFASVRTVLLHRFIVDIDFPSDAAAVAALIRNAGKFPVVIRRNLFHGFTAHP